MLWIAEAAKAELDYTQIRLTQQVFPLLGLVKSLDFSTKIYSLCDPSHNIIWPAPVSSTCKVPEQL